MALTLTPVTQIGMPEADVTNVVRETVSQDTTQGVHEADHPQMMTADNVEVDEVAQNAHPRGRAKGHLMISVTAAGINATTRATMTTAEIHTMI